jgi:membrane-associated protease RseP (regulator of RpoE activity)
MNRRTLAVSLAALLTPPLVAVGAEGDMDMASPSGPPETQAPAPIPAQPQTQTQPQEQRKQAHAQEQIQSAGGYLGVLLGPVPFPLRAQLGPLLPPGQGIMIRDVVPDSPAARAGLKTYDILVGYDEQKLYSPDQLTYLVRADKSDTTITLNVVHNGRPQQTEVTLGEAPQTGENEYGYPQMMPPMHYCHSGSHGKASGNDDSGWESFDSMSLIKLDDGGYKAKIAFLGDDGKLIKKEFDGSRDEIRQQIMHQRDLPRRERQQLLQALGSNDNFMPTPGGFAPGFYGPDWFNWQPGY